MNGAGVGLLVALYLLLPMAQAWDYISSQTFAGVIDHTNYLSSIFAYDWLLLNVLIGLKLPFLQNALPYDHRIKVHVWTSLGLFALLTWHAVYYFFFNAKTIDPVSWSLVALFCSIVVLGVLWVPLPGLKTFRTMVLGLVKVSFLQSYDWLKAGHKLLYFALAGLTYWHVIEAKLIGVGSPWASFTYQGLFVLTALLFFWTRLRNWFLPSLEVLSVTKSSDIVQLTLKPHRRVRYQAGQFAFLRFHQKELRGEEHPFSFTSAPYEPEIQFAMRALGDFTSQLGTLSPGDRVRVNAGFGAFRPASGRQPLALIGSGIGAAPLVSILKDIGHTDPEREVIVLLAVNRRDEVLGAQALQALSVSMPHLKLKIFVYEEDARLYGPELLKLELVEPRRFEYYLCSSEKVRVVVVDALKSLGVKSRKIHFEAFQLG